MFRPVVLLHSQDMRHIMDALVEPPEAQQPQQPEQPGSPGGRGRRSLRPRRAPAHYRDNSPECVRLLHSAA